MLQPSRRQRGRGIGGRGAEGRGTDGKRTRGAGEQRSRGPGAESPPSGGRGSRQALTRKAHPPPGAPEQHSPEPATSHAGADRGDPGPSQGPWKGGLLRRLQKQKSSPAKMGLDSQAWHLAVSVPVPQAPKVPPGIHIPTTPSFWSSLQSWLLSSLPSHPNATMPAVC